MNIKKLNFCKLCFFFVLFFSFASAENIKQRHYNLDTANFIGQVAPNFKIKTSDNNIFLLSEEVGKETLIFCFAGTQNFTSAPFLKKIQAIKVRYNKKPVKFILISQDYKDLIKTFLDRNDLDFVFYSDNNKTLTKQFKIEEQPGIVIIGVDARVQLHASGTIPKNIDNYINKVIKANIKSLRKKENIKNTKEYFAEHFADIDNYYRDNYRARIYNKIKCPCQPYLSLSECGDCQEGKTIEKTLDEYFSKFHLFNTNTPDKNLAEEILKTNVEFLTD
ncbi:MAG: hypothetical protein CVV21_09605 [Candidatus Goldiibacteriota bacterium HGW-Goldbacteria-1]|jgi:peroxiredoxin|nr:MAG: hypothetical protein CVV21_09605 [Candidatus Goldiibacteriota bacterium HGW-Goldbacteria-1]